MLYYLFFIVTKIRIINEKNNSPLKNNFNFGGQVGSQVGGQVHEIFRKIMQE